MPLGSSGLIVSLKERAADPKILPQAFRQIERWSSTLNWITPTLLNGCSSFGAGNRAVQFGMDPIGFVHIRGLLEAPAGGVGATTAVQAFLLPPSYRVVKGNNEQFPSQIGLTPWVAQIAVRDDGGVYIFNPTGAGIAQTYWTLSGITFKAGS